MGRDDRPFVFVAHARDRMRRRGITEDQVHSAWKKKFRSVPAGIGKFAMDGYVAGGRILRIVYRDDPDAIVVVTVYWPEEGS